MKPNWPKRLNYPRSPTKRLKGVPSWCWPKKSMACVDANLRRMKLHFIPFTAQTRMSGVDFDGREVRKGAADAD